MVRVRQAAGLAAAERKGTMVYDDVTAGAQGTAAGISRRDMLKRSAVVGGAGALMWAAPSITKFGSAAFGTEGTPFPGEVSWVIVWFDCPGEGVIRVKYEGKDDGYRIDPSGQPSQNFGCPELFADVETGFPSTVGTSSPNDVTVRATEEGWLQIQSTRCTIVAWVLHDGSCGEPRTGVSNCRSSEQSPTPPEGPVTPAGPGDAWFEWTKCVND